MKITGRITQMQSITGTIKVMSDSINGTVGDVVCINGTISRQTKRLSGTVKNPSNKPSGQGKNDHVFVIVDLLQMHEQQTLINSANTILPLTAQNLQAISGQININTIPTTITVNSMTANNISFSAENIMVNEEVYSNANE